jgi:hypothetical protein
MNLFFFFLRSKRKRKMATPTYIASITKIIGIKAPRANAKTKTLAKELPPLQPA